VTILCGFSAMIARVLVSLVVKARNRRGGWLPLLWVEKKDHRQIRALPVVRDEEWTATADGA
jgi:hypothetical protein